MSEAKPLVRLNPRSGPFSLARAASPVSVCLVRCPTITSIGAVGQDAVPPIGLAYLAGALSAAGHRVTAVDAVGDAVDQYTTVPRWDRALLHGLLPEQICARIPRGSEVIGISAMFSVEWPFTRKVVEAVRAAFPKALIVLGGEHVTACPEYILETCAAADVCVLGEGEETFLELLTCWRQGGDLGAVKALVFRREGRPVNTGPRPRIRNIDEIPEPKWDIFPVEAYIDRALTHGANLGRCMPILASRGCPYQCTFCSSPFMWTTQWMARKPELVIAEMKRYIARYRVTNFDFYDLTAIVKRDWILDFSKKLAAENLGITWQLPSGTRSEAIDGEVAHWMYTSGGRIMNYAPESGSPEELARIKKKVDIDKMLQSMRQAHRAGLQIKVNFIFGLPGSSWKNVLETFGFIARLALTGVEDIHAFGYSPYPNSELFSQLQQKGRLTMDETYFESLLAYTDPFYSISYSEMLTSSQLRTLNAAAMAWFYALSFLLRPQRFFKLIYQVLSRDASTKLTMAMANRRRKTSALKLAQKLGRQTVIAGPGA